MTAIVRLRSALGGPAPRRRWSSCRSSSLAGFERRIDHIPLGGFADNYPMSLDEAAHRLFVGVRQPARVLVFDTVSGKPVGAVPCVGDTDDLFYDARRDRVYVIGGEGYVDVFDARLPANYARLARMATRLGARTGLWSSELDQLFVAWPLREGHRAEIQVLGATAQ